MTIQDRLRALDSHLIDRVCQPVLDRMPGPPSPALVGRNLILGGASLCSVGLVSSWRGGESLLGMGSGAAAVAAFIYYAFQTGRGTAGSGVAPVARLRDFHARVLMSTLGVILFAMSPFSGDWIYALSQCLTATGLYVAACRRPPPGVKKAIETRGLGRMAPARSAR